MKIKSKFRDYYDGVGGHGLEEPVYPRVTKHFSVKTGATMSVEPEAYPEEPRTPPEVQRLVERLGYEHALHKCYGLIFARRCIFFCGRIYTGIAYDTSVAHYSTVNGTLRGSGPGSTHWLWKPCAQTMEMLTTQVKKGFLRRDTDVQELNSKLFDGQGEEDWVVLQAQMEARLPVIMIQTMIGAYYRLTVNPMLKDMDFGKAVPAEQAWQELSMFWGNLTMPERHTVNISDKDRHAQHGFDQKSFRRTSKELRGE